MAVEIFEFYTEISSFIKMSTYLVITELHLRKYSRLVQVGSGYVHVFFLDWYIMYDVVTFESGKDSQNSCRT